MRVIFLICVMSSVLLGHGEAQSEEGPVADSMIWRPPPDISCGKNQTASYCPIYSTCSNYTVNEPYYYRCWWGGSSASCNCAYGFVLESEGSTKCILKSECPEPPVCPPFEEYQSSGEDDVCDDQYGSYSFDGCHCKKGYQRLGGVCLADSPCSDCIDNQYYSVSGPDPIQTCSNYGTYNNANVTYNATGCFCKNEYIFDEEGGDCVLPEDCSTVPNCDENEEFSATGGDASDCWDINNNSTYQQTQAGCYCKEGYARDTVGDWPRPCIPKGECICGENQRVSYGGSCELTCDTRYSDCNNYTSVRCVCAWDYVLESADSTNCILQTSCPNPPVCEANETVRTTDDKYCPTNPDGTYINSYSYQYEYCHCKEGYQKDPNGLCIAQKDCPIIECSVNATLEVSSGVEYCPNTYDTQVAGNDTWLDCFCKDGYVYDTWSYHCILPEDCLVCNNETEDISNYGCVQTCDDYSVNYCSNWVSEERCYCKNGYVLASNESTECIPVKNCPNITIDCGPNKVYKESGFDKDCSTANVDCEPEDNGPGCYCQDGYVLKAQYYYQECVPISTCPVCGKNEEISTYAQCQLNCQNQTDPKSQYNCPESNINVCVCKSGYVLESAGSKNCIPSESCEPLCGENQVFLDSGEMTDCSYYLRNQSSYWTGGPGCYCAKGYIRSLNDSTCIPYSECACPENEQYYEDASNVQEQTCDNWAILGSDFVDYGGRPVEVPPPVSGCYCMDGYVRDSASNECVLKEDCSNYPPECGPNQVFNTENQNEATCDDPTPELIKGPLCFCQSGFVRNYKSECVQLEECPSCPEENTVVSPCVHCYDYCNGSRHCSWDCLGDCDCYPGYVWAGDGTCVPVESCPDVIIQPPSTSDPIIVYPLYEDAAGGALGSAVLPTPVVDPTPIP